MNLRASIVSLRWPLCLGLLVAGGCNQKSVMFSQAVKPSGQAAPAGAPEAEPSDNPEPVAAGMMPAPDPAPAWMDESTRAAFDRPVASADWPTEGGPEGRVALDLTDDQGSFDRVTAGQVGEDFDPCISRDGAFMVFSSTRHRATSDLYAKRLGSSAVTQLTSDAANDVMPALSPDGSRIAFSSDRRGTWNIYVMSSAGGPAVQLTSERGADLHPSWSPDGRRLVFSRLGSRSGQWELWVIDASRPQTAEFIGYGLMPQWCPRPGTGEGGADKIAFQRARQRGDRAYSVWTVDYKPGHASAPTEVVPATDMAAINPSWSADGQWIAYVAARVSEPSLGEVRARPARSQIWLTAADGSSSIALTSTRFRATGPAWAPDGKLYFASDRGGTESIWTGATAPAIALATGRANPAPMASDSTQAHPAEQPAMTTATTHESHPESRPAEIAAHPEPAPVAPAAPTPAESEPVVVTAPEPKP